jgi:hypothetical protein
MMHRKRTTGLEFEIMRTNTYPSEYVKPQKYFTMLARYALYPLVGVIVFKGIR